MQCFLRNIYLFTILPILILVFQAIASITVLDKGLVSLHKDSVGLQFYVDIENQDRLSGCRVYSRAQDCCLTDPEEDCNTMSVYGSYNFVKPKDRETLVFVYPTIYQHDQLGYCNFVLDYQCGRNRRAKRQKVDIVFDTRINRERNKRNSLLDDYIGVRRKASCDTLDQDSLNECEPVDCNLKYTGERPFFDGYIGKCVEASICESSPDSELPDVVYIPSINACRDLEHPLTVGDIYAISTGMGVVTETPSPAEVRVEVKSNCSTISQNLKLLKDIMYGKLCPLNSDVEVTDYSSCCKSALWAILTYIIGMCALLLSFVCCVQTTVWIHKKMIEGDLKDCVDSFKGKFKTQIYNEPGVSSEVRNTLLREVIVRDIPIELRDSIVNICEKMGKKVKRKKRYRHADVGSQVSLTQVEYDVRMSTATSSANSSDDCDEEQKLLH